jgi:hypothetical protein
MIDLPIQSNLREGLSLTEYVISCHRLCYDGWHNDVLVDLMRPIGLVLARLRSPSATTTSICHGDALLRKKTL